MLERFANGVGALFMEGMCARVSRSMSFDRGRRTSLDWLSMPVALAPLHPPYCRRVLPRSAAPCCASGSGLRADLAWPGFLSYRWSTMVLGPIDTWTTQTLDELVARHWQESIVLEFKRQLGAARTDKKETAKDITAMANTAGGWIVYGIDEQPNAQGIKTAHAVAPLADPNTAQRIDDIAAEAIVPPVRYRSKTIPYGAGSCVVLRIEPSTTALHMVHAYDEFRYYRRTELAARPMSEPEVRQALEHQIRQQADGERWARELLERLQASYDPPFGWMAFSTGIRDERVDPRTIQPEALRPFVHQEFLNGIRTEDIGFRAVIGTHAYDLGVARDGSTWMKWPLDGMDQGVFKPVMMIDHLMRLAAVTWTVWNQRGVFPVAPRLALQLECAKPLKVADGTEEYRAPVLSQSKWLSLVVTLADLQPGERIKLARTIADRIYQVMGRQQSPFFGEDGKLRTAAANYFRSTPW